MSMQIILAGLGIFALLGAYVMFKLKQARREIEQLLKTNEQFCTISQLFPINDPL
ncbi:hypothetical protein HAINFHK1212_1020 [Haemophilus influenzae HK1212]|uniref:Uncharacterized protein n=1 Tax=Haemophilus influenzae HK1212 TaxID=456482 RepID=A0A7G2K202_HAEIF|nr:hypothetical protein HAINFHK1212_1020 [Haemophilus influenzae HK1212]